MWRKNQDANNSRSSFASVVNLTTKRQMPAREILEYQGTTRNILQMNEACTRTRNSLCIRDLLVESRDSSSLLLHLWLGCSNQTCSAVRLSVGSRYLSSLALPLQLGCCCGADIWFAEVTVWCVDQSNFRRFSLNISQPSSYLRGIAMYLSL